MNNLRLFAL